MKSTQFLVIHNSPDDSDWVLVQNELSTLKEKMTGSGERYFLYEVLPDEIDDFRERIEGMHSIYSVHTDNQPQNWWIWEYGNIEHDSKTANDIVDIVLQTRPQAARIG